MSKWRLALLVLVLGAFIVPEAQAYYKFLYVAKRDGHLKIWRTKDGVRTQPEPAVDTDMLAGDSAWLVEDHTVCNDEDIQWTNASTDKKSTMVGTAYAYNTFTNFTEARTDPLRHFVLADMAGLEITVEIELEGWYDYLQSYPLPDETQVFSFAGGLCPDLPGFMATETLSGLPYTGDCEVEVACTLMRGGQAVQTTGPWAVTILIVLIASTAVILWRRRAAA